MVPREWHTWRLGGCAAGEMCGISFFPGMVLRACVRKIWFGGCWMAYFYRRGGKIIR